MGCPTDFRQNQPGSGISMKALVIGGGGFVGSAIVRQLVARGDEVAVFGRSFYPHLEKLDVHQFQGDILYSDLLIRSMQGYDTVFHVAAKAGIWGPRHEFSSGFTAPKRYRVRTSQGARTHSTRVQVVV